MNPHSRQTVVLFSGLPYSGKTAIIHRLMKWLPGKAIYVDGIFRDMVSEEEVCLDRWLQEGRRLVDSMIDIIVMAEEPHIYVELGIMQARHRGRLMGWLRENDYRLVPILLRCESRKAVEERQRERALRLARKPEKLKIAIDLDELYGPINEAFDRITEEEGYFSINTAEPIDKNVEEIYRLIVG